MQTSTPNPAPVEDAAAAGAEDEEEEAKLFTPALTRRLVGVGLFTVLVYSAWLFSTDLDKTLASLKQVSGRTIALGLLLSTLNYALRCARWHAYLGKLGLNVPVPESATVFTSGFAMTVTPAKMGEVLKSVLLKKTHKVPIAVTAPVVVAERVTDLSGLVLLAAVGALAFEKGLPIAILGGLLVAGLLVVSSWRALGEFILRLCEKLPVVNKLVDRLREAYESLVQLSGPGMTLYATGLSTVAWGLQCVALLLIAGEIAPGAIDIIESCVSYSAPLLAGTLVLLPGGLGATEASMTGVLMALSDGQLNAAGAAAVALLVRLVTFWWAVALGVVALSYWRLRYGAK